MVNKVLTSMGFHLESIGTYYNYQYDIVVIKEGKTFRVQTESDVYGKIKYKSFQSVMEVIYKFIKK
jgi:hypothetical protein